MPPPTRPAFQVYAHLGSHDPVLLGFLTVEILPVCIGTAEVPLALGTAEVLLAPGTAEVLLALGTVEVLLAPGTVEVLLASGAVFFSVSLQALPARPGAKQPQTLKYVDNV